ncbi:ABC transporter ATP-binding protein [Candidatus Enterococcus courvalinii]|uniref:ABC transporter ATP-binding protein n=1 Tax=Candidatus Enterococcus courvalinii TaxID=2815329 RepID=A0ABS3I1W6_9ENTE|nr:ABC transporter ATP-binding protein [Enterococcus sp. MSG2901]MBO0482068.1 ABC transporter ATP-binding protein [Enterococcus sp. MSG2901]
MTEIIEFHQVQKKFAEKVVIDQLNFVVHSGEIFVLVGPSGSGKTSTLKMINGLIKPTSGEIYFKGENLTSYNLQKLRWKMGYVLQQIALFPTMTVKQNIEVIPEMLGWDKSRREQQVDRLLEKVGLSPADYRDRFPRELSGGEQQRIGILRAIAANPEIILMDEPFSALDPLSRASLQELVLSLHQELGTTVVFVTHNMEEAVKLGNRIGVMKDGQLIQCDTPEKLLKQPNNAFVQSFFEETNQKEILVEELIALGFYAKEITDKNVPMIEITAPLTQVYAKLAQAPVVQIINQGNVIGELSGQDVFAFLSRKESNK